MTELERLYRGPVRLYFLKHARSADDAEDLAQDTYLKVWRYQSHVEPDKLRSYTMTAAANVFREWCRRHRRRVQCLSLDAFESPDLIPDAPAVPGPESEVLARAECSALARQIERLGASHREALLLAGGRLFLRGDGRAPGHPGRDGALTTAPGQGAAPGGGERMNLSTQLAGHTFLCDCPSCRDTCVREWLRLRYAGPRRGPWQQDEAEERYTPSVRAWQACAAERYGIPYGG